MPIIVFRYFADNSSIITGANIPILGDLPQLLPKQHFHIMPRLNTCMNELYCFTSVSG
jgi:hypothetical protein